MAPHHLWLPWVLQSHQLDNNVNSGFGITFTKKDIRERVIVEEFTIDSVPGDNWLEQRPKGSKKSIHPLRRLSTSPITNIHCLSDFNPNEKVPRLFDRLELWAGL